MYAYIKPEFFTKQFAPPSAFLQSGSAEQTGTCTVDCSGSFGIFNEIEQPTTQYVYADISTTPALTNLDGCNLCFYYLDTTNDPLGVQCITLPSGGFSNNECEVDDSQGGGKFAVTCVKSEFNPSLDSYTMSLNCVEAKNYGTDDSSACSIT